MLKVASSIATYSTSSSPRWLEVQHNEKKLEIVTIAEAEGLNAASYQFGMFVQTIRRYMKRSGETERAVEMQKGHMKNLSEQFQLVGLRGRFDHWKPDVRVKITLEQTKRLCIVYHQKGSRTK